MKKKLILLAVLAVVFAGILGFRYFMWDTQNAFGRIKVVSSPSSEVFIDNLAVGKTPYEDKYKIGEYLLKLIPEGESTSSSSWQGKIKIYKNALTYVNRELASSDISSSGEIFTVTKMETKPKSSNIGEIYVESDPTGAIVYLDNDEKGVAPLVLADVPKGDHELSVFMPGFFRRTQKINIDAGYRVNANFKLSIDQTQQKPTPIASPSGMLDKEAATPSAAITASAGKSVIIKDTPTGFLRVRFEPTINASEAAQVKPGDTFDILDERDGWYKISYEPGKEGWVSGQYASKE